MNCGRRLPGGTFPPAARALRGQAREREHLLDKLLDAYLAGDLSRGEYQRKRSALVGQMMEFHEKAGALESGPNGRFEPLINFISWSKTLHRDVFGGRWRALAQALRQADSSRA